MRLSMEELMSTVRTLVENGKFGHGKEYLSLEHCKGAKIGAQFASQIGIYDLRLRIPHGAEENISIVIKLQLTDPMEREMRESSLQFANEVFMYTEFLPFLNKDRSYFYPKMYYCYSDINRPEEDIIIMENMTPRGFLVSEPKLFLDFNHISLALIKLGEFHSWSYKAKRDKNVEFHEKIAKLQTPKFKSGPYFQDNLMRGIKPLLENHVESETLKKFVKLFVRIDKLFFLFLKPEEPFATLCHGDFCKNNVLYKYDGVKSEKRPIDCALFDFQQPKYTSPAVDLSFFLYMHTTADIREKHWDDLLQIYWKTVQESVKGIDLPSYEDFLEEFSQRAVYSYFPCSFFAPMMLLDEHIPAGELMKLPKDTQKEHFANLAGEKGLNTITSIMDHLLKKKYIHTFLAYYEKCEYASTDIGS